MDDGKFTQIAYVKTNKSKISGLITGSDKGNLYIFPFPFYDRILDSISAHAGEVTKIILSPDNRYLFSTGSDGSIFMFQISEQLIATESLKGSLSLPNEEEKLDDMVNSIVDEALADIVLVKKHEMEEWQQKQEQLKHDLNVNKKKVEQKLLESKQKYERQYVEIERQKDLDIKDLDKRYEDLKRQKDMQDRQNFEAMKKMELNHLNAVEDLQQVYEKKLYIENSNYLKLEQERLEMIKYYESKIAELSKQNQEAIDKLLREFKNNLLKVQDEYKDSKKTANSLQDIYETKLNQQEDEHEDEIFEIKEKHKKDKT